GFALAPCKPEDREWFARCLTAVEDIPTEAMLAGIDWSWESFPEYLANVERLPKGLNYGMYIGHSALRMYVLAAAAWKSPRPRTICAQWKRQSPRRCARARSASRRRARRRTSLRMARRSRAASPNGARSTCWLARWRSLTPGSSKSVPIFQA